MADVLEIHEAYDKAEAQRSGMLRELGTTLIPHLVDLEWVNRELDHRGHPELRLKDPAGMTRMDDMPNPTDQSRYGSFAHGFYMINGYTAANKENGNEGGKPLPMDIPSLEELFSRPVDLRYITHQRDHRARPAFWRMGVLDPGFTVNLVTDISSGMPLSTFRPEIFYAYRIMSKLVDRLDPGVLIKGGKVNKGYLFSKRVVAAEERVERALI